MNILKSISLREQFRFFLSYVENHKIIYPSSSHDDAMPLHYW